MTEPSKSFRQRMPRVAVLRWGHRERDKRVTTHVALTARALGASEFILSDVKDEKVKVTVDKVVKNWGDKFSFDMGKPWREVVEQWRAKNGVVVHLTVYGENIQTSDVMQKIKSTSRAVLVIVGSQKVPAEFFSDKVSDFNVAVGNQPHSECSSLAVFLDRFFEGCELSMEFDNAKIRIVPQKRGKKAFKS